MVMEWVDADVWNGTVNADRDAAANANMKTPRRNRDAAANANTKTPRRRGDSGSSQTSRSYKMKSATKSA